LAKKGVLVTSGVYTPAVAGWLGSYGGADSTSDISRGTYDKQLTLLRITNET
jgi:hypothetical protein